MHCIQLVPVRHMVSTYKSSVTVFSQAQPQQVRANFRSRLNVQIELSYRHDRLMGVRMIFKLSELQPAYWLRQYEARDNVHVLPWLVSI